MKSDTAYAALMRRSHAHLDGFPVLRPVAIAADIAAGALAVEFVLRVAFENAAAPAAKMQSVGVVEIVAIDGAAGCGNPDGIVCALRPLHKRQCAPWQ